MSEKGFSHIKKEVFDYEPVTRQGFQLPLPAEVCVSIDHHDDLYVSTVLWMAFFIAQYVDSMALSAANIVYPAVSILLAVGIMFGTGGSAVVAAKIGQENWRKPTVTFLPLPLPH